MQLPKVQNSDGFQKRLQRSFGGLNHTIGAAETDLWDMRNLTTENYPVLSVREQRKLYKKLEQPNGIYAWDGLIYVDGTSLYFRDKIICEVTDTKKRFAGIGAYVVILPDKIWLNVDTEEYGTLGASYSADNVIFGDGKIYGEDAKANMLQKPGADFASLFKEGDAVKISGCTLHPNNNKTPIIREIDGDKLYFYENVFELDGDDEDPYIETGTVTIEREIPDMDFICENENRLWGCKGNDIYASKLGDIFNWNVFDGLSTDSYAVNVGSAGRFTGCVSYGGYAVFFKEDHIFKMYGAYPAAFRLMGNATSGLLAGCDGSFGIAGEILYFLSRNGFTAYSGGIPQNIAAAFGNERLRFAAGGSDGIRYFASATGEDGRSRLYVYDTKAKLWAIEDESEAMGFAWHGGCLYMLTTDGRISIVGNTFEAPAGCEDEKPVKWFAEFADTTAGYADAKGVNKLRIRLELERRASAEVFVMFDSDGEWLRCGRFDAETKTSYDCPIPLRRCDHYRIKICGTGGANLYSLEKHFYGGTGGRTI